MVFVLVHGAWHGGWCWQRVASLLRAAGHDVHAPTLTGVGERAHLFHPGIDLRLHVQDVLMLLDMEDVHDAVLVGHSYGGMVITGVADQAHRRLRRLVYLDAFVPESGKALSDYIGAERAAHQREQSGEHGAVDPMPPSGLGITRPDDVAWVSPRLTRHPYRTMTQRLELSNTAAWRALPKTYVNCHSATGSFVQFAERLKNDASWQYHELDAGHDAMVTDPQGVATILLKS
jgi:pimeloyl-ACP methyl ester carboxylesterase